MYLDADDLLPPEAIERRFNVLQATGADVLLLGFASRAQKAFLRQVSGWAQHIEDVDTFAPHRCTEFWAPPAALTYRRTIVDIGKNGCPSFKMRAFSGC